ncbi:MAG: hypothetical protein IJX62_08490 [Clostridia bacterium]|nr:hypothetical protein [Clostridia bacterium]
MKRNNILTRILLLTMALLTVLSMAACNGGSEGGDTTATTTDGNQGGTTGATDTTDTAGEPGPNIPAGLTFGGDEFKIYLRGVNGEGVDYAADLYVGDTLNDYATAVERAVYTRMEQVASTYDVVFDVQVEDGDVLDSSVVNNSAMTGTDVYDLVVDHGVYMLGHAAKNLLMEYEQLPYVDVEKPWWNQEVNETFRTPGGKLFVMTGDISYMSVGAAFSMFFNKDIIADVQGLDSPYEKVYADEWTFEEFESYVLATDSNLNGDGSGVVGQDKFGYATGKWRGPVQMFYSTDGRVLERRGDEWKFTLNSNTANKAVVDFRDLVFQSGSAYVELVSSYTNLQLAFMANEVAFFDDHVNAASVFKGSGLNFGLLPWPKYNDDVGENRYCSAVDAGSSLFGVLRNTTEENAKKVSAIMESMAYLGSRDVLPFYFDTILSYQYLKDDDSIHMLQIIYENLVFDFGYFYSELRTTFMSTAANPTGGSLNQAFNTALPGAKSSLEKWEALDDEH